jgi:hypothetical protein
MAANGLPKRRPSPYWFFTGRLIKKSFRYKGERTYKDSVLRADISPAAPFNLKAPGVLEAFFNTLSAEEFADLRMGSGSATFFTRNRMKIIRKFWETCKNRYVGAWLVAAKTGNARPALPAE